METTEAGGGEASTAIRGEALGLGAVVSRAGRRVYFESGVNSICWWVRCGL